MQAYTFNQQAHMHPVGYRHTCTQDTGLNSEMMVLIEYRPAGQGLVTKEFSKFCAGYLDGRSPILTTAQLVLEEVVALMPGLLGARVTVEIRAKREGSAPSPAFSDAITVEYQAPTPDQARIPPGQQVAQNPEA